ncbi:unnamed protein product, partial [Scytosiphon promiscuus]
DGSALRGRELARLYDSGYRGRSSGGVGEGGGRRIVGSKNERRNTCEPDAFGDFIGDLDSDSGTPTPAAGDGDAQTTHDSQESVANSINHLASPEPGRSAARRAAFAQPASPAPVPAAAAAAADPSSGTAGGDADSDEDSFDAMAVGSGEHSDDSGNTKAKKDDRRSTASPTMIGALMGDLGLAEEDGTDEFDTADSTEAVKASSSGGDTGSQHPSVSSVADASSPASREDTPPVARRTRSKSPSSLKKTRAVDIGLTSPLRPSSKRASLPVAASPAAKTSSSSSSQQAPESARGLLKSCLSSRKRPREIAAASTPGGFRSPPGSSLDSPDLTADVDGMLAATGSVLSPSNKSARNAGGGWGAAPGVVKTPGMASSG